MYYLNNELLNIDENEVIRYLGYKNSLPDDNIKSLIEECKGEIRKCVSARYTYKLFEIIREKENISLENSLVRLNGADIYDHLIDSSECVLMAVTLGGEVDRRIRYFEKVNMTKALVLDACANTAIEEVCDNVCDELYRDLKTRNKVLTKRFSPGYGDLTVEIQKSFLSVLNAEKNIGLTSSAGNMLIPLKSVTAIAGIVDGNITLKENSCLKCNKYSYCQYRRENRSCGV